MISDFEGGRYMEVAEIIGKILSEGVCAVLSKYGIKMEG